MSSAIDSQNGDNKNGTSSSAAAPQDSNGLVQISSAKKALGGDISRRRFLQIVGAGSAATALSACADPIDQKIYPNVFGDTEQVPGVATWFRSTCTECSAGCGIEVRSVDGRAVKIEGNSQHPVNRGGLCGLGQSAIQSHYDPDRVRQPLMRESAGGMGGAPINTFKPISWDEAYAKIAGRLKDNSKKKYFITGELSGAIEELVGEFSTGFNVDHVVYEAIDQGAVAKASELVYGTYGIPAYSIDKAEVVLNFGADFLETWVSPCEYARDWAKTRKSAKPVRVVHVEPRLSLTGASADLWLNAKPGSEVKLALFAIKELIAAGRGQAVRGDVLEKAKALTSKISIDEVASDTGLSKEKILVTVQYLLDAKSSLVLAGGAAASTSKPLALLVAANLLNLILGNVGTTVSVAEVRKPKSSAAKLNQTIDALKKDTVGLVFISGTNPAFSMPAASGFKYALKRAGLVVSFATHLDETAELADLILPANTSIESWGDVRSTPNQYGLIQPAMSPIFDTRSLGDMLLGVSEAAVSGKVGAGAKDYLTYLKASWTKLHSSLGVATAFPRFWVESLERGGYFSPKKDADRSKVAVNSDLFKLAFEQATFDSTEVTGNSLVLFPFPSVLSFDGRAANRPWMHEIPDPISQVIWDAWAEIHPETAKRLGLAKGDFVTARNRNGEVDVPVYITEHVNKDVIAIPLGHGHTAYGRYAKQIANANVFALLPFEQTPEGDSVALLSTRVSVFRGRGQATMVTTMGSDSQLDRGLARTTLINASGAAVVDAEHAESKEEHALKQMYVQREHPLYKWGMAIDLASCTGCAACAVACYAENNIAVAGKIAAMKGREMSWLRIERYFDGSADEMKVSFLPMLCQHCGNAPCEPVCPVYATYHNEEGLNVMVYNRCVGTRYCSNNCSYKVRRFNWHEFDLPEPMQMQLNPDVTKRMMGVMEKCTFCVQRINAGKDRAKDLGRLVEDGDITPACVQSCPTEALSFGNLNDPKSNVSKLAKNERAYKVLDQHINTQPAISYLNRIRYEM